MKDVIAAASDKISGEDSRVSRARLDQAIARGSAHLVSLQQPKGYWVGELEADASVTAGYIPLMYWMTGHVDETRRRKAVNYILSKQNQDGSWPSYFGGRGELNVTVQVYFALKLAGKAAEEPIMTRAKDFVLAHGGVGRCNTLTKVWLALFGQYDWDRTPTVPVEMMFLPGWYPISIYDFASWSRETIVALMVISDKKPVCQVPASASVNELFSEERNDRSSVSDRLLGWDGFFRGFDRLTKMARKSPFQPGHRAALRRAERWIVEHQEADGSWGGIMLPWVYSLMALKSLGYDPKHPVIEKGLKGIQGFIAEDEETLRLQPATSPVWDTAWSMIALRASGLSAASDALIQGAKWLLGEEISRPGDWRVKNRRVSPGGWAFEFDNDVYPDIDDTAVVPRALLGLDLGPESPHRQLAVERALRWSLAMQCDNGGWAAFDRNNNKTFLEKVPFADFMTPLDPTSPDVTAHMLEVLGDVKGHGQSVKRAIAYLRRQQNEDGAWYGRWGVNYVYGTGLTLAGLRAVGESSDSEYIRSAVRWLNSHQNGDGGWGETCETYDDPTLRGTGSSTASQTAWALIGLIASGQASGVSARKGIGYLLDSQKEDGSWREDYFTGTGFPRAFYLRYDLYRTYFPLLALSQYRDEETPFD